MLTGSSSPSGREGNNGAVRGSTHSLNRVVAQIGHDRQRISQLVAGDDLGGHLSDSPRIVVQCVQDGGLSSVVPGPQKSSGSPNTQPVVRAADLTGHCPPCWRAAKSEDQRRVGVTAPEEVDTSSDDRTVTATRAFCLDTLPRRSAPT